jgi:hypothetical protein
MPGRVLNFLEFSGKYSTGSNEPLNTDDLVNAPSNFEEGFDDSTYDGPQIGPNRPVSGNYEATPPSPGESGAPAFSATQPEDMNAPEEEEEGDESEESEDADESDESEENEEKEEGNPEAGANPKEKVEEGFRLVKGFAQFVNESYMEEPAQESSEEDEDDFGANPWEEEEECCPECGEAPISNEYGVSCGCNM